jgi:hypothetical protein
MKKANIMAAIYPSQISKLQREGVHSGELETLQILKDKLPDSYSVFHSVHWTNEHKTGTAFGEIDFVIVNNTGEVLVIEQKNGSLEESGEELFKNYWGGIRKSVNAQISRTIDNIKEKFQQVHGSKIKVDYMIFCPDYSVKRINAIALNRSRIVDATNANRITNRIQEILPIRRQPDDDLSKFIKDFFLQTFVITPDIHTHISNQDSNFTRLSGGLVEVIGNLEMTPFLLRIKGSAGCGKSLVAAHLYRRSVEEKKRPLLVCYNRPLSERMKHTLPSEGMVTTWYGLVDAFLQERGHSLDYEKMNNNPKFWKELEEQVVCEEIPDQWQFDTLIVDEGQDFEQEWADILRLFLKQDGDILWLEDDNQNLGEKQPIQLDGFVTYHSKSNYRSPESISQYIKKKLPFDFDIANLLPGLGVGVKKIKKLEDQQGQVEGIIKQLLSKGFSNNDIVIVTLMGLKKSSFSDTSKIGDFKLRNFTGKYDSNGNQIMSDGDITFESIYRFKGQQAPAIIIVDNDPSLMRKQRYENPDSPSKKVRNLIGP